MIGTMKSSQSQTIRQENTLHFCQRESQTIIHEKKKISRNVYRLKSYRRFSKLKEYRATLSVYLGMLILIK
jgi:hypothetical protein